MIIFPIIQMPANTVRVRESSYASTFFIKSYVFPPQQEDGGVPPPEITLHRIASVSMMEQQANELYSILGTILQKRESD